MGTILLGAVLATAFPSDIRHETFGGEPARADQPAVPKSPAPEAAIPEFVPLINLGVFLAAADENDTIASSAREAAEVLSAKFSTPAVATTTEPARPAVEQAAVEVQPSAANPPVAGTVAVIEAPPPAALPVEREVKITPVAVKPVEASAEPVADAPKGPVESAKAPPAKEANAKRPFQPSMGLGAEDIAPATATKRPPRRHLASLGKLRAAKVVNGIVDSDFQIGIPGQSMEPLISNCAKAVRACRGDTVCGC